MKLHGLGKFTIVGFDFANLLLALRILVQNRAAHFRCLTLTRMLQGKHPILELTHDALSDFLVVPGRICGLVDAVVCCLWMGPGLGSTAGNCARRFGRTGSRRLDHRDKSGDRKVEARSQRPRWTILIFIVARRLSLTSWRTTRGEIR